MSLCSHVYNSLIYIHIYAYVYEYIDRYANYWVIGNAYTQAAKLLFAGVLPMYTSLTIHDNFPFFIPSPTLDLVTPLNVC